MDTTDLKFQWDGATCHTSGETIAFLSTKFPSRVISRKGDTNCPPRSRNLTPLDYFLWYNVKERACANNRTTIHELKPNIHAGITQIEPNFYKKSDPTFRGKNCGLQEELRWLFGGYIISYTQKKSPVKTTGIPVRPHLILFSG